MRYARSTAARVFTWMSVLLPAIMFAAGPGHREAAKGVSYLTYRIHHPLHHIESTTKDFECTADVDDATHTVNSATFTADISTFDSGNSNRDSHAMEVLDALDFPTVSFTSTSIVPQGDQLQVKGVLNFHGLDRPVMFVAQPEWKAEGLTVTGDAQVSLTDFKIDRPTLLMIPVSDTLQIHFSVQFPEEK